MNLKINKIYLLYSAIVILALGLTYFRVENQKLKSDIRVLESNINARYFYDGKFVGVNAKEFNLYSLIEGQGITLNLKEGIVLYANNKGCKKCTEAILSIYKNHLGNKNIIAVISNYAISEFNPIKDYILKYKNIYWDKEDSFSKVLDLDLRKTGPLLFVIKEGIIVSYCTNIDVDNKSVDDVIKKITLKSN